MPITHEAVLLLLAAYVTNAATVRCVDANSSNPTPPYTNWATAATAIQDAVDIAVAGDEVVVTNGIYATGGRAVYGTMTNRVVVDKPITLRSVNGPEFTIIEGAAAPGGGNGNGAIRCIYLASNTLLIGFTLATGHTLTQGDQEQEQSGGGVWCEVSSVVTNCTLTDNSAQVAGGGAYGGTLHDCVITQNTAEQGGGAYGTTLSNCSLTLNSATYGAGACYGEAIKCTFSGNSGVYGGGAHWVIADKCTFRDNSGAWGGGAHEGILNDCTFEDNSAGSGGGASEARLIGCSFSNNSASYGGATEGGTLNNCTLTGNSAYVGGGGADSGTLNNCTLIGNWALTGGGTQRGTLRNCILYYNTASIGPNYYAATLSFSCTTPLPEGTGNIDAEPLLASATHLSAQSPCIGRGSTAFASGEDIDGEPWGNPPCMGADQYVPGQSIGPLTVGITAGFTNVAVGWAVPFQAVIEGALTGAAWEFGDGTTISNTPWLNHAWVAPGEYPVRLTAFNDAFPKGVSATLLVRVVGPEVYYVNVTNATPQSPYTNWATAAHTIQEAVDAGTQEGRVVLVAKGMYDSGGRAVHGLMTNRVVLTEGVQVRSVHGPAETIIAGAAASDGGNGDGAIRCVYLGTNAVLSGFTLTNGHTRTEGDDFYERLGGGAWSEGSGLLTNCILTGNSAADGGGGAYRATLNNCVLTSNSAGHIGGGADYSTLNNCTLIGNSAGSFGGAVSSTLNNCTLTSNTATRSGGGVGYSTLNNCNLICNLSSQAGGAYWSDLNNCIVYGNMASTDPNYDKHCTLKYCCTTPLPRGPGNIDADPLLASISHVSAGSPCVGRGSPAYAVGVDVDGEIWRNPPCIGTDQFVAGQTSGPLTVRIAPGYTTVTAGFAVPLQALIEGRVIGSVWDFGDGSTVSNRAYLSHAWAVPGEYRIRLTGYNDSHSNGATETMLIQVVPREVYHVNVSNAAPLPPYTNWSTAARTIQEAVDAGTQMGRLILVAKGVYDSGGRAVHGSMTNRVVLTEGVEVRSVDGPELTVITGAAAGNGGSGDGAIRCVYVGSNTVLSGFSLTNGHTRTDAEDAEKQGGGAWCELSGAVRNCTITANSASFGGGTYGGAIDNCTLTGNSAVSGGAAFGGTLYNCVLRGNQAKYGGGVCEGTLSKCNVSANAATAQGGGAYFSTLFDCTLIGNSATNSGGGASNSSLKQCTLRRNSAYRGGGAESGSLHSCLLTGNLAASGGGAESSSLNNCTLTENSAFSYGGGAAFGTLTNCTLTGNSATNSGGGARGATLNNCIIYSNTAPTGPNSDASTLDFCCTTPLPGGSVGSFTNAPLFVDYEAGNLRLQSNSPCINAGTNGSVVAGTDLDGRPRIVGGNIDVGAYEYQGPGVGEFVHWGQAYGLATDGSADLVDSDEDGHSNWEEWTAGTVPTDAVSVLRLASPMMNASGVLLRWTSIPDRTYVLERCRDPLALGTFYPIASGIPGQPGMTSFSDTNTAGQSSLFYRVRVGN